MSEFAKKYLIWCGITAAAGAAIHVAIIFGGPDWYAFFRAPPRLVEMARNGQVRAPLTCAVITAFLALLAAYAFSATGVVRRLPGLRLGLAAGATALILRGVLLVPLIFWHPHILVRVCDCPRVDTFAITTSLLSLVMGIGFALGALARPVRP